MMTARGFYGSLSGMIRFLPWFLAVLVLCARTDVLPAAEAMAPSGVESLVRLLSPEFRRIEKRLTEIDRDLERLPRTRETTWGSRYGHRSGDLAAATTPDWVQLDMGKTRRIDLLALVPAHLSFRGAAGDGHGFPKRFRVELADNPEMRGAVTLIEHADADVANPGRNPMVMKVAPTEGRYLRFTSLKHCREDGVYFWALEELMALEGNLNVARAAELTMSSSLDLFPLWVPVRLVDGQHALGMPVDVNEPSPSIGYLSALSVYSGKTGGVMPPGDEPWCAVDLGQAQVVDQIRVLPLESDAYHVYGGRGFPREFEVQLAHDRDFEQVVWSEIRGSYPLGYPAGCAITLQVPGVEARYARVVAKRLWSRDTLQVFGLAEFQVYGGGRNLAQGKPVMVKDKAEISAGPGWAPAHLVDGYTSRYRLIEWPDYLALLNHRGELEREMDVLYGKRASMLVKGTRWTVAAGILLVLGVLTALVWFWSWQRRLRAEAIEQMRNQIARDLHDDIGSNLGGILLLGDIGSQQSADETSRRDFATMRDAAQEASVAMRDIVWLVERKEDRLKGMIKRMREAADMILRNTKVDFVVQPATFDNRKLSLLFRRHVFFAFKEALNNVRKHAGAAQVRISLEIRGDRFRFVVKDDGEGFDSEHRQQGGCGLSNMERRASRVGGFCEVTSQPGRGTVVTFEASLKT